VLSPRRRTVLVIESNRGNLDGFFFDDDRLGVCLNQIPVVKDCRDAQDAMSAK